MEWNRFPVVEKPLAKIPLPPSSPPHGRSVCRTLPSKDSANSPPPVRAVTFGPSLETATASELSAALFMPAAETKLDSTDVYLASSLTGVGEDPVEAVAAEIAAMVSSPMISSPVQPASECLLTSEVTPVTPATAQLVASTVPLPAILPATPAPTNTFAPTILSGGMSLQAATQALFSPVHPAALNVALRTNPGAKTEAQAAAGTSAAAADSMAIASPEASPLKRRSRSRSASDSKTKRKRKTPEQLSILEREFEANPMPNKDVRDHLSQHLGLTSRQVQIWFQNKRAKVKNARGGSGGPSSPETSPRSSPTLLQPIGAPPPPIFPEGFTDGQLFFDMMGGGGALPIFSLSPVTGGSQLHLNVEPAAFQNEYMRLKQAVDA